MIEQALKVIASFKDEASAGIKKLQAQIDSLSKNKTPLGGLSDGKAAANLDKASQSIKKVNDEARKTANGGLADLAKGFAKIKADFAGLLSGGSGVGDVVTSAASSGAAAFTALGAAATGAGVAISKGLKEGSDTLKVLTEQVKKNGELYTALGAAGRAVAKERLEGARAAKELALAQGKSNAEAILAYKTTYNSIAAQKLYADSTNRLGLVIDQVKRKIEGTNKIPGISSGIFKAASKDVLGLGVSALGATAVAASAAAAAIVAAVGGISIALNAAADDAAEFADKLGISVERLKVLRLIADETGTSVEGMQKAFDTLTKVLDKTDENSDRAGKALINLGLGYEEIKKLKPQEAAGQILERYEALGKTAEATAAVQVLLGASFRDSSLGIKAAAKEFDSYADRVKEYGAGESKILAQQGAEQEVAFNNFALALAGIGQQLAENVGPAITQIVQVFADVVNAVRKTEIAGKLVQVVFGTLKLLTVDLWRALGGLGATLAALFAGEFKQAAEIAKMTFSDAADAVTNFGKKTDEAKSSAEGLSEAEAKAAVAAQKAAAARKKAAEQQAKLFKDAEDDLYRQLALMSAISEADKLQFEIDKGKYKTLSANQKALLVDLAQMIDLKKKEQDVDALKKDKQAEIDQQKVATSLAEEELRLAGLSTAEREAQIYVITELNKLRTEGKDIDAATLEDMQQQIKVLGKRKQALIEAQEAAKTTAEIIADSEAAVSASVMRNIDLAKELLTTRKITEADYARYVIAQTKRITDLNQEAADQTVEFWRAAAQGIQGALSNSINDIINGDLNSLVNNVKKAIDQIVANFLAAQLAATLFGSSLEKGGQVGGLVGQAGTFISGLFGGARAAGGPVDAGKVYMVGEKGPELVQMGGSGSVVSNDKLGSLGKTVNVNFRVEAIDASSFRSKIDEFKRDIAAAVSDSNLSYGV